MCVCVCVCVCACVWVTICVTRSFTICKNILKITIIVEEAI